MKSQRFNKSKILLFIIIFIILLIFFFSTSYGAILEVPYLLVIFNSNSNFTISPYIYTELSLSGGEKYSVNMILSYTYQNSLLYTITDTNNNQLTLYPYFQINTVYASINNIFNLFNLTIFYGDYLKIIDTGEYLTKSNMFNTSYDFSNLYTISGYGIDLEFPFLEKKVILNITGYQKLNATTPQSFDIYLRLNLIDNLTLKFYAGTDALRTYRGGINLYFHQEKFFLSVVVGSENILGVTDFVDLFILFEQKVKLPQFYEAFVIFSKPSIFKGETLSSDDKNTFLLFLDLSYNDIYQYFFAGAITEISLVNYTFSYLLIKPYIKLYVSGLMWKLSISLNPTNFNAIFNSAQILFETKF